MARMRHDPSARGTIFEGMWQWVLAGQPKTAESEREQYGALWYWLAWWGTSDWHVCSSCGEGPEERAIRLLTQALDLGTVGLSDDPRVALDDGNVKNVIQALDEIETPPNWSWYRDHACPARAKLKHLEEV
jgi:hypothetical protein